jgi:hypothetical protein
VIGGRELADVEGRGGGWGGEELIQEAGGEAALGELVVADGEDKEGGEGRGAAAEDVAAEAERVGAPHDVVEPDQERARAAEQGEGVGEGGVALAVVAEAQARPLVGVALVVVVVVAADEGREGGDALMEGLWRALRIEAGDDASEVLVEAAAAQADAAEVAGEHTREAVGGAAAGAVGGAQDLGGAELVGAYGEPLDEARLADASGAAEDQRAGLAVGVHAGELVPQVIARFAAVDERDRAQAEEAEAGARQGRAAARRRRKDRLRGASTRPARAGARRRGGAARRRAGGGRRRSGDHWPWWWRRRARGWPSCGQAGRRWRARDRRGGDRRGAPGGSTR